MLAIICLSFTTHLSKLITENCVLFYDIAGIATSIAALNQNKRALMGLK